MSILRRAFAVTNSETLAHLRAVPFFARLSDVTLTRLAARSPLASIAAQEVLFRQGETGETLYVILSGAREIIQTPGDTAVRLSILRTGEYYGEMALLDDEP